MNQAPIAVNASQPPSAPRGEPAEGRSEPGRDITAGARGLYIPSLDGLRCVAILLVFLSHAMMAAGVPRLVPGHFGVTLFFFLSGYLITTLLRLEIAQSGNVNIPLFFVRRALRIFPTFYLVLATTGLFGLYMGATDPWYLLAQALHTTNYLIILGGWLAPIAPYTDVYWSLAVEEHFYLAFPALFLLMSRRWPRREVAAWLLGVCGLVLLWRCILVFGYAVPYDRTYVATDTRIDAILFGCILALWGNPALDATRFTEATWKRLLFPLSVVGLLLSLGLGGREIRESLGYTVQALCLFPVFIVAVRYPEWGVMRLLNLRPVKWIGLLSYAIYLTHVSVLHVCKAVLGATLGPLTLSAAVLTLGVAALLYYGIERPVGRLRQRYRTATSK